MNYHLPALIAQRERRADFENREQRVFDSEQSIGRERMAADCLECFPKATASQIINFLANQPKPSAKVAEVEGARELAAMIKFNSANLNSTRH